ncbi:MAG: hypothetical protein ACKO28_04575 [Cyanobium sp.]
MQSPEPKPWTESRWARKLVYVKEDQVNPSFLGHALLAVAIAGLAIVAYNIVVRNITHKAEEWRICTQIQKQTNKTTGSPTPSSNASPAQGPLDMEKIAADIQQLQITKDNPPLPSQISRLTTQLRELEHAQQTACTLGVYFFAHRSATYAVATAAGIATLAALAFVSKKGWDQSNNAIINIGMTSGLVLFSALTFSQLYGQGSNYESQRIKYALALDLINKVASATANLSAEAEAPPSPSPSTSTSPATNQLPKTEIKLNTSEGLKKFINALDQDLKTLHKLDFGMDATFAQNAVLRIAPFLNSDHPLKTPGGGTP